MLAKMAVIHDDPANPKTVYRIQNDRGLGPWHSTSYGDNFRRKPSPFDWRGDMYMTDELTSNDGFMATPMPNADFNESDFNDFVENHSDVRFGTLTEEQLKPWMEASSQGKSFKIVPVLASKVWQSRSGKQVFFLPHKGDGAVAAEPPKVAAPQGLAVPTDDHNLGKGERSLFGEIVEGLESLAKGTGVKDDDQLVAMYAKMKPKQRDPIVENLRAMMKLNGQGAIADVAKRHIWAARQASMAKSDFAYHGTHAGILDALRTKGLNPGFATNHEPTAEWYSQDLHQGPERRIVLRYPMPSNVGEMEGEAVREGIDEFKNPQAVPASSLEYRYSDEPGKWQPMGKAAVPMHHHLNLPVGSAWKGRVKVIEPGSGKVSWHSVRAGQYKSGDGHALSARLAACPGEDDKAKQVEQEQRNTKQPALAPARPPPGG